MKHPTKLTKLEMRTLISHTEKDLDYAAGGTYNKEPKEADPDYEFDKWQAAIATRAIKKMWKMIAEMQN